MENYTVISVDTKTSEIFCDFAKEYPDLMIPVEEKAFIESEQIQEFIVTIGPPLISALSAYLVARVQYSKGSIYIKKGDIVIDLKNIKITPEAVMDLIKKLEQKDK